MEEYTRDSLRQFRRAANEPYTAKKGSKLITLLIILLLLSAGILFLAGRFGFSFRDAKNTISGWSKNVATAFQAESHKENDIEKTVNAALQQQNASI